MTLAGGRRLPVSRPKRLTVPRLPSTPTHLDSVSLNPHIPDSVVPSLTEPGRPRTSGPRQVLTPSYQCLCTPRDVRTPGILLRHTNISSGDQCLVLTLCDLMCRVRTTTSSPVPPHTLRAVSGPLREAPDPVYVVRRGMVTPGKGSYESCPLGTGLFCTPLQDQWNQDLTDPVFLLVPFARSPYYFSYGTTGYTLAFRSRLHEDSIRTVTKGSEVRLSFVYLRLCLVLGSVLNPGLFLPLSLT